MVYTTVKSLLKRSQRSSGGPRTEIIVNLAKLECELDVTIIDRIGSLIKPSPHRPYNGSTAASQGVSISHSTAQAHRE